jgi:hypothetical protein
MIGPQCASKYLFSPPISVIPPDLHHNFNFNFNLDITMSNARPVDPRPKDHWGNTDCSNIPECWLCDGCTNCTHCGVCIACDACINCMDCIACVNCINCSGLIGRNGAVNEHDHFGDKSGK